MAAPLRFGHPLVDQAEDALDQARAELHQILAANREPVPAEDARIAELQRIVAAAKGDPGEVTRICREAAAELGEIFQARVARNAVLLERIAVRDAAGDAVLAAIAQVRAERELGRG